MTREEPTRAVRSWRPKPLFRTPGCCGRTVTKRQLSSTAPWRPKSGRCLVFPSAAVGVLKDLWILGQLVVRRPSHWSPSNHQWVATKELDEPERGGRWPRRFPPPQHTSMLLAGRALGSTYTCKVASRQYVSTACSACLPVEAWLALSACLMHSGRLGENEQQNSSGWSCSGPGDSPFNLCREG